MATRQLVCWAVLVLAVLTVSAAACGGDLPGSGQGFDLRWIVDDGGGSGSDLRRDSVAVSETSVADAGPPRDAGGGDTASDGSTGDGSTGDTAGDVGPAGDLTVDTAPPPPLLTGFAGLFHQQPADSPLDLATLVTGGAQPYGCDFYYGPGLGTLPWNSSLSGCVLTPSFGPDDPPGTYGFIVVVSDQSGQKVEVPIVVRNGSCNTSTVSIAPAEYPVRVISPPGKSYTWTWSIDDVDTVCDDAQCAACAGCVLSGLGTKAPMHLTALLDCSKTGDICMTDSDIENPIVCPSPTPISWSSKIRVKSHTPLRSDGGIAWVTVEADASYSGTKTGKDCGDKTWACHIEVLEH